MSTIQQPELPEAEGTSTVSFADAAKNAAEDAASKGWEKRKWERREVVLQVDVGITNPGHIDQYRVIIK